MNVPEVYYGTGIKSSCRERPQAPFPAAAFYSLRKPCKWDIVERK